MRGGIGDVLADCGGLVRALPHPSAPVASVQSAQATLSLSRLNGGGAPLTGGVRWRVFAAEADPDGSYSLKYKSSLSQPTLTIPPGE